MSLVRTATSPAATSPGRDALAGVSFALEAGQAVAVLGPNGGGKTTLFRALLGELPLRRGTVELDGRARLRAADRARAAGLPGLRARRRADGRLRPHPVVPPARPRRRAAGARGARARRARRPSRRPLRHALGRPAPARADRARARAGRAACCCSTSRCQGVDARQRRPHRGACSPGCAPRAGRCSSPPTTSTRRAASTACCACTAARSPSGAPAATLTPDVLQETYGAELIVLEGGGAAVAVDHHAPLMLLAPEPFRDRIAQRALLEVLVLGAGLRPARGLGAALPPGLRRRVDQPRHAARPRARRAGRRAARARRGGRGAAGGRRRSRSPAATSASGRHRRGGRGRRRCSGSARCSRSRPRPPPRLRELLFGDLLGATGGDLRSRPGWRRRSRVALALAHRPLALARSTRPPRARSARPAPRRGSRCSRCSRWPPWPPPRRSATCCWSRWSSPRPPRRSSSPPACRPRWRRRGRGAGGRRRAAALVPPRHRGRRLGGAVAVAVFALAVVARATSGRAASPARR